MNDDRSLERAARSWIEQGPTRAPERAVEAALLRIETTTQERGRLVPWRNVPMMTPTRLAAAAVVGALVAGGILALSVGGRGPNGIAPTASARPSPSATSAADYSTLRGRILVEHLGRAPDGSEAASGATSDRRRFYLMSPADMTAGSAVELLPGAPPSGKTVADISPDGQRVVFQDMEPQARLWEAHLDGTGLHQLETSCSCIEGDPAYDPTGTKIAFVHLEVGGQSWIGIRDLSSGTETKLATTAGPADDASPEQPSWSPDGTKLVFHRLTMAGGDQPTAGSLSIVDLATGEISDLPTGSLIAGDADWSPDGSTIVFTNGPVTTAGIPGFAHDIYVIKADGTGLERRTVDQGSIGASWTPDGAHILYYDDNHLWLMAADGSDRRPVDQHGMDLSDDRVGYTYVGHWIDLDR
jgi:dipeptidyl aminopeptidase/acylaminoacyl peptidase